MRRKLERERERDEESQREGEIVKERGRNRKRLNEQCEEGSQRKLVGLQIKTGSYSHLIQVLTVRGNINDRIFDIRKEEVNICIEQGIGQEDKLNQLRYISRN